jgi:hypothetical protein
MKPTRESALVAAAGCGATVTERGLPHDEKHDEPPHTIMN